MKEFTEVLSFDGYNTEQITNLIRLAMDTLKWPNYAKSGTEIIAEVKTTPWYLEDKITVQVYGNEVWMNSKFHPLQVPVGRKNKQNIELLKEAVFNLQLQYSGEELELEDGKLQLTSHTTQQLFEFEKKTESVYADIHKKQFSELNNYYVTYSLGAIMIAVFGLMSYCGISFFAPDAATIFQWGGNFQPYTTGGQYWRLITYLFVHVGILHLVFNLIAFISIGRYLEPVIGHRKLLICFFLTGILAGTVSMWWDANRVSAGASGAIFGLYGVFISLLVTGNVSKIVKSKLLPGVILFVGVNLLYGLQAGIDNAAHIGGLISGLVLGVLLIAEIKWPRLRTAVKTFSLLFPFVILAFYIAKVHTKDADFNLKLPDIAALDSEADWPIASGKDKSDNQLAGEMERISIPKWTEAATILQSYPTKELNSFNGKLQLQLQEYTKLRLKEAELYIQKADDSLHFSSKELVQLKDQIKLRQAVLKELFENQPR